MASTLKSDVSGNGESGGGEKKISTRFVGAHPFAT